MLVLLPKRHCSVCILADTVNVWLAMVGFDTLPVLPADTRQPITTDIDKTH